MLSFVDLSYLLGSKACVIL